MQFLATLVRLSFLLSFTGVFIALVACVVSMLYGLKTERCLWVYVVQKGCSATGLYGDDRRGLT